MPPQPCRALAATLCEPTAGGGSLSSTHLSQPAGIVNSHIAFPLQIVCILTTRTK
eukprot:c46622_g1_i1 orf=91-255(+)